MSSKYDNTSIDKLIGCDKVRLRPAAVLGSGDIAGARHGFTELYGNALDEISSGYGDRLDVCYYEDAGISIRDYGRGVPLGFNEKLKEWNWHVIYNDLYGGGKYGTAQEELSKQDWDNFDESKYNYLFSVGLNGLGAAATQYTSEYFTVKSYRGGKVTTMHFKKGMPVINGKVADVFRHPELFDEYVEDIQDTDEPDGTFVHWKPDIDVFTEVDVTAKWLLSKCRDIANIANIQLTFKDFKSGKEQVFERGTLVKYIDEKSNNKAILSSSGSKYIFDREVLEHGTIRHETNNNFIWVCKAKVAMCLTEQGIDPKCFHNNIYMGGGDQYDAIKSATSDFFNKIAKEKGYKFEYSDYSTRVCVYVSTFSNICNLKGQTKDEVNQQFIYDIVYKQVSDILTTEYNKGNKGIEKIISDCVERAEERIALKELANQVKLANKVSKKQNKQPAKYTECKAHRDKNYKDAELWIVEGDSAAGSLIFARDSDFQAVLPITGKFINALKNPTAKVLENETVKNIITLVGTGIDLGLDDEQTFNIDNLKFGKIIFCTDADIDGFQIRILLYVMFFKLCPKLFDRKDEDAILYIAETPLYELERSAGEPLYAYTDKEKDELLASNSNITNVNRFKGLGEVNEDVLAKTTVSPEGRRLVPLTIDFSNQFELDLIDALYGKDKYKLRKRLIADALGEGVLEMLEVSDDLLNEFESREFEEETEVITVRG